MALKIVYKICCGIDVHKTFVAACIASTNSNGVTTYKSHRFSTYTKGLKELLQWLLDSNCKDVCMESTGKYWIPVYNVLEKGCSIVLAHPKYVKAIRGKKTDKKDAKWIADLFKHDLVAGSFMPPADIRQLRDLMRYRYKLTCFMSSEKNRLQNCLTVSNIQLGSVVSDTFGKSSMKILDKILEDPLNTSFDLEPLIHGSMKDKIPELELAVDGYISPEQAGKLKIIKKHCEDLESRKAELEKLILALASPYQQELDLILTAPSFKNPFSAIAVISEIGVNMEAFPSAKHLCSWAGLTPTNNESAGKKKSVRVSKAGCFIKPLLVQCATAVVKSEKHPEIRNRYLRIRKRRGHKKAIIAIARMLLTALYNMLKNKEPYNADLYKKSDVFPIQREITVEQAILIAQNQGYKIKSAS
ncbi:transposase IS116/IS110/IS902 family protein [Clostridium pasteurianum DSM 525 = ATCC 6013]|uniref:Transposase IS111A/IS1328/IS1533 n=1 Tax=Clostridium pasteurianum DSM 525 = ATCC 6013 TaxID=1262449 RepID=A0A0H3JBK8_CLOPA|nr:IS110 family transposase [Clostridium pasteurianum]AJA49905.1 transposase IS116/IS110/IS902 family protein [Clostridium pasteurianum DSM 525 = ATCC 6013]AJA53893.1 transposase IS116/IS110/IS902 family protein [Clostridium pasteurianum DSM 525 = ATCC 6013]AOZ77043.1 transposase [Clostridium pasteurianum DSM 525 = ATCC 6013]AOZ80840.1 transposase [Clostridium pasteurianum]ELP57863.1 transposase IS116/IS110/IS902 family protein [Clostridium pasteurianum DSM 525 = ATCC 6013]